MKKNELTPFIGITDVLFGSTREKIRKELNLEFLELKRNEFAENTSDYYKDMGFFIEYDKNNRCDAIEFTESSNIYYKSENILSIKYSVLRNTYDMISSNNEVEEGVGVTYYDLGFAFTKKEGVDKVQSVLVFSQNYW